MKKSPMLVHAIESDKHGIEHYLDGTPTSRKFAIECKKGVKLLKDGKLIIQILLSSLGSALLSLPYIHRAFGPTEAEVVFWGVVSLWLGLFLFAVSIMTVRLGVKVFRLLILIGFVLLAMIQIPPIILWFAFHGSGI